MLPAAVERGATVLRRHHIAPGTFVRVMAAHAQHADDDTGRGCIPTVEHIQTLSHCSERTVQRARAAARELRIVIEVFRGRHLTLDERIAAYDAGQTHRGWSSVYALGCPLWLARHLGVPLAVAYPQPGTPRVHGPGERGTPPIGNLSRSINTPVKNTSSARCAEQRASRATSTRPPRRPKSLCRFNPAALALAGELQALIPALAGVHPGRLAPLLNRFAFAARPWTAEELAAALTRLLRARGWDWPNALRHPPGYLARLLGEIEHRDQLSAAPPSVARSRTPGGPRDYRGQRTTQLAELHRVQAETTAELAGHGLCAHGVAGANPSTGRAGRCAFCRRHQ